MIFEENNMVCLLADEESNKIKVLSREEFNIRICYTGDW